MSELAKLNRDQDIRFHILFPYKAGPYGGANQFFKALGKAFSRAGCLADGIGSANVVIFNSHHDTREMLHHRARMPQAIFIHRVDGPMRRYNSPDDKRDAIVELASLTSADATVFQSAWSQAENEALGWKGPNYRTLIGNAPDPEIFNRHGKPPADEAIVDRKIRIIACSWSPNLRKGFDIYSHLDQSLDFDRFDFTFAGNAPCRFQNLRHLAPLESHELALELKRHDIYLTATQNDPCSNSLLEALACGLPAVARRSGGNPELVGAGGVLFDSPDEVLTCIQKVAANYRDFVQAVAVLSIDEIAGKYIVFAKHLWAEKQAGRIKPKRLGPVGKLLAFHRLGRLE
jgi:glycosyltransferase involved in cell wall biosynthesis